MSGFDDLDDAAGLSDKSDERDSPTERSDESDQPDRPNSQTEQTGEFDPSDLPYIHARRTVKGDREHVDLFVLPETEGLETDGVRELEDRVERNLSLIDAREAIYLAGLRNLDDAARELQEWGYKRDRQ